MNSFKLLFAVRLDALTCFSPREEYSFRRAVSRHSSQLISLGRILRVSYFEVGYSFASDPLTFDSNEDDYSIGRVDLMVMMDTVV